MRPKTKEGRIAFCHTVDIVFLFIFDVLFAWSCLCMISDAPPEMFPSMTLVLGATATALTVSTFIREFLWRKGMDRAFASALRCYWTLLVCLALIGLGHLFQSRVFHVLNWIFIATMLVVRFLTTPAFAYGRRPDIELRTRFP